MVKYGGSVIASGNRISRDSGLFRHSFTISNVSHKDALALLLAMCYGLCVLLTKSDVFARLSSL